MRHKSFISISSHPLNGSVLLLVSLLSSKHLVTSNSLGFFIHILIISCLHSLFPAALLGHQPGQQGTPEQLYSQEGIYYFDKANTRLATNVTVQMLNTQQPAQQVYQIQDFSKVTLSRLVYHIVVYIRVRMFHIVAYLQHVQVRNAKVKYHG